MVRRAPESRLGTTRFKRARTFIALVSVATFAAAGFAVWQHAEPVVITMRDLGWDRIWGFHGTNPQFAVECLLRECRDALLTRTVAEVKAATTPIVIAGVGVVTAIVSFILRALERDVLVNKRPASGEFAQPYDLLPLTRSNPKDPPSGYIGVTESGLVLRPSRKQRLLHAAVMGSQGAGKTTGFFKPNMWFDAQDGECVIVLDIKYPDPKSGFFDTIPWFAKTHDVQLFLPYSEKTLHLPLLRGGETPEGALEIAEYIIGASDNPLTEYYTSNSKVLLGNLIVAEMRYGSGSIGNILKVFAGSAEDVVERISRLDESNRLPGWGTFTELGRKEKIGVMNGLVQKLRLWMNPLLDQSTSLSAVAGENVDLSAIGTRPSLLYVGIPQQFLQGDTGELFLRLLYRLISRAIRDNANKYARSDGQLPINTNWYLDEFANIGFLQGIAEDFNTMRSFNVAMLMGIQNFAQGRTRYTRDGWEAIYTGIGTKVYLPSKIKEGDRFDVSKVIGETTVLEDARTFGQSKGNLSVSVSHNKSFGRETRPLVAPEEFDGYRIQEVIVKIDGVKPLRAWLPRLDQAHPTESRTRNPLHNAWRNAPKVDSVEGLTKALLDARRSREQSRVQSERLLEQGKQLREAVITRAMSARNGTLKANEGLAIRLNAPSTASQTGLPERRKTMAAAKSARKRTLQPAGRSITPVKEPASRTLSPVKVGGPLAALPAVDLGPPLPTGDAPNLPDDIPADSLHPGERRREPGGPRYVPDPAYRGPGLMADIGDMPTQSEREKRQEHRRFVGFIDGLSRTFAVVTRRGETRFEIDLETTKEAKEGGVRPNWISSGLVSINDRRLTIEREGFAVLPEDVSQRIRKLCTFGRVLVYARDHNLIGSVTSELLIDQSIVLTLHGVDVPAEFELQKIRNKNVFRIDLGEFE